MFWVLSYLLLQMINSYFDVNESAITNKIDMVQNLFFWLREGAHGEPQNTRVSGGGKFGLQISTKNKLMWRFLLSSLLRLSLANSAYMIVLRSYLE
mmetsp:Transcript_102144/g.207780  ORF Transcript_102144/g.207780 Transcript_102144/m.207780 type:complete len:96 (+) Transcript_102144:534-821(+)